MTTEVAKDLIFLQLPVGFGLGQKIRKGVTGDQLSAKPLPVL